MINTEKILDFVREHGFRVFAAAVTGSLTYYAGFTVAGTAIYALTLVALAEGMSLYWPYRLESAQSAGTWKNVNISGTVQWASASIGIAVAWVSIIVTDLASAVFIANSAGYEVLTAFQDVPKWSQNVVVYVLPILAFTHGLLLTAFYVASPEAAHARTLRAIRRASGQQIAKANADAEAAKAQSYVQYYQRNVTDKATAKGESEAELEITRRYKTNPTKDGR